MKASIHQYFSLGTISWMSYPGVPVLDALQTIAADDFYDAIEIPQMPDRETLEKAKAILAQSGLRVCYGAQPRLLGPGLNPNDLDEAGRLAAEKTLLEAIDEAAELGAGGVAFLAGHWEPERREESFLALAKTTDRLCSYAKEKGIRIELEVFDYDMDKKALIGPAPLAARFAETIRERHQNFGLLVDLSHFPTTYEDSRFVVRTLRPYITHLHIGNAVVKEGAVAFGDQHPRFGFPESANGVEALTEFFRVLREEGFFDPRDPYVLSFEVKPWQGESAEIVVANTKRVIRRAWALLEENAE